MTTNSWPDWNKLVVATRLRDVLIWIAVLCFAFTGGCDSRSVGSGNQSDATLPDAYVPSGEFCDGVDKVEVDGRMVAPVAMTTGHIAMGCCDGAYVDLHTGAVFGRNLVLFIRAFGLWEPGEVDLSQPEGGPEVGVAWEGITWDAAGSQLSGTFRFDRPGDPFLEPSLLSFCITVEDPGSELWGARLYAKDLVLIPWGWSGRFTLSLLQDPDISAVEAAGMDLGSLDLRPPLLDATHLRYYVWSEHRFVLDSARGNAIAHEVGDEPPFDGVPFVVTVRDQRLYLGAFMSPVSSATFDGPTIVLPTVVEGEYVIDPGFPGGGPLPTPDPRGDAALRSVLETSGKLVP